MLNELAQSGGVVGSLVVVVLLLVKEVVARHKTYDVPSPLCINNDKIMTKELCEERHKNLQDVAMNICRRLDNIDQQIKDLPKTLNGGHKK